MSSADDRDLARRVAQGDRNAFDDLIRCHQSAVFNAAYRLLGNVQDAEDAAQETFIRAYQFFDKFDTDRPLAPWLKRIAVNVCLNRLESRRPASSLDTEQIVAPDLGPEAQTLIRQRDERLRAELARLPPRCRAVIELRHFQDMNYKEIAAALGRPLSDVKSDLFRARKLLAECLKDLKSHETSD